MKALEKVVGPKPGVLNPFLATFMLFLLTSKRRGQKLPPTYFFFLRAWHDRAYMSIEDI